MVMSDEAWYIVRNTQGVTGFIGSSGKGAKPIPLLPQEVDRILNSMGMSRVDISKDLTEGKKVKIIAGPFKDMMAKIDSVDLKCIELPFLNDGIIPKDKLEDDNFPYLQNGDVLLTDASEDYDGIGKALEIIDTDNKKIIGGLHTIGLRNKTNELAIGFYKIRQLFIKK